MNNFLSFSAGGSGAIEAENPVYDLLLKDEELEAAADKAHADMQHMYRRLALLDEQHSAYEPLLETLGSSVEEMRTTSNLTYGRTMQAIDQLNNREFLNSTQWLIALSLLAGGIASGPTPPGFAGVGGAGVIVGAGVWDGAEDVLQVRRQIEKNLELVSSISDARVRFDQTWSRLVEDEQPEQDLEV